MRVFLLRMVAAKNSRKRRAACSPASATIAGTTMLADASATVRAGRVTASWRPDSGSLCRPCHQTAGSGTSLSDWSRRSSAICEIAPGAAVVVARFLKVSKCLRGRSKTAISSGSGGPMDEVHP